MTRDKMDRRQALKLSGMGMLGALLSGLQEKSSSGAQRQAAAEPGVAVVRITNSYATGQWFFDPIGVFIEKGQKVRWVARQMGGSVYAFHPSNDNHELRIPENARPFNSGEFPLMRTEYKGMNVFEWTFDVEGTYDYYSRDQESLGMVGRIVVGQPGGPAEKYQPGYGTREGRAMIYPSEIKVFQACASKDVVAKKTIPFPKDLDVISHPYGPIG
jgi:plastocyanin